MTHNIIYRVLGISKRHGTKVLYKEIKASGRIRLLYSWERVWYTFNTITEAVELINIFLNSPKNTRCFCPFKKQIIQVRSFEEYQIETTTIQTYAGKEKSNKRILTV